MMLVVYVAFLLKLLPTGFAVSSCPATQYSGRFKSEDHTKDQAIIGHSYKNVTIEREQAQHCFSHCVFDCKCLSYQISGTHCELIDEDTDTTSIEPSMVGYRHYQLKQRFKDKDASCSGVCRNGCCHSNPCMHGGTCVESCEDVKRKFKCICPLNIKGRYCQFIMSCAGIPGNPESGVYTITRPYLTSQFKVYCDFTSEPNFIWTLVESFEYSKQPEYLQRMFFNDHPVKTSTPNWMDYRLSLADMRHVRTNATHWRATCNFESVNLSNTEYVRQDMKTQDILHVITSKCYSFNMIKLGGTTCTANCVTTFRHESYHPYFSPCFPGAPCIGIGCNGDKYEAFGTYGIRSYSHNCSSSPKSTTNWWFGVKLN